VSLTIEIRDLQSNVVADISTAALTRELSVLHNQTRSFKVGALSNNSLFTDTYSGDSMRNLRKGNRKLLVWEDGQIIFHGRIFSVERVGTADRNDLTITAFDPMMELGFDSEDRAGRVVRGSTIAGGTYDGNFIDPKFVSSVDGGAAISGPDLIHQIITNSLNTGSESDPSPGEGPLPIDLTTGTFDLDVPPAVDLSVVDTMDWPVLIGDFIAQLVATGVCDVYMRPVDPSEGLDPYAMVALSAVSSFGTDRHATVHFDFWTGDENAKECKHTEDFSTINNKLYVYLGPRIDKSHWRSNITPGSSGTTIDPTSSRATYGVFMSIREFDSIGTESGSRPLYLALWNAEQGYRVEPRDLLWITPQDGSGSLYTAPQDFEVGDLVAINVGSKFGLALAETQRVYGYTKTWSREDVPSLSQLLTSADISV
jgi:hypothetical protein